jgi:two-component system sensor histidine kinase CssS
MALARYLSRPLIEMEHQAARMAEGDWQHPLRLERKDEIGHLAGAFEQMRQRLVRQDEVQRTFLQNVSHDLKTPVMVIRSYVQAILDGIYPEASLDESILVINQEADRLEKRIKQVLYLNKLNYLHIRETHGVSRFNLADVIQECVQRFRAVRPDLRWNIDTVPLEVEGIRDQVVVALENLLENQIRYARSVVTINLGLPTPEQRALLRIFNDGPQIEEKDLLHLFEAYYTGEGGDFGLGLAIVQQICELNHAQLMVENVSDGVVFSIQFKAL